MVKGSSVKELRTALEKAAVQSVPPTSRISKDEIRQLHTQQRLSKIASLNGRFDCAINLLKENLAKPSEIVPHKIVPELISVDSGTSRSALFCAATLNWSIPVSQGFGRRIKFLVMDRQNNKLIGIFALCDPVFNQRARDNWIGWTAEDRCHRLVHIMDLFVLGALPPYNYLLGGKLIALLAASKEVIFAFRKKYGSSLGVISQNKKNSRLALLTTTSALGRSSIYSRLKIPGGVCFVSGNEDAWFTRGYGHFHIEHQLFLRLQKFLASIGHPYADGNRFGNGPNWKFRLIRQAAKELGLSEKVLYHGIRRQVFLVPLASNTRDFLNGRARRLKYTSESADYHFQYWLERWCIPRSERSSDWRDWVCKSYLASLEQQHYEALRKECVK